MQNNKNNIILSLIILILSFVNIIFNTTNISALSYESKVGIGFTFNPTLSVSLSLSDLIISNLTPSSTADSNSINVSVATNAAYGYTLSATVGDNTHNNSNLTHSNNTNIFSSIATDADLASLDEDENNNIWGYSTSLDNGSSWSNYNGLSSSTNTTLIDSSNTTDSTGSINFKIGARAGSTQPSGTYTNTINFIAVSKVAPMSLLDSFIASGAEQLNGYFKMQDMTHNICSNVDIEESELQLIDVRDNKIYWVAKLKDGNCWMTQNLDFDIQKDAQGNAISLTSETTDLVDGSLTGAYSNGYTYIPDPSSPDTSGIYNGLITWAPNNSANKAYTLTSLNDWESSYMEPYSYDRGEIYPDNTVTKETAGSHALSGNYYNWSATIASNNTSALTSATNANNSICPKGWRLQSNGKYEALYSKYNDNSSVMANGLMKYPTYFIRSGYIWADNAGGHLGGQQYGVYWTNINYSNIKASTLTITESSVNANNISGIIAKSSGYSVRCLAR